MKKRRLFKKNMFQQLAVFIFAFFIISGLRAPIVYSFGGAKEVEEYIVLEKEIEREKEKSLVEHFYSEGKRLLEEGDYEAAIDEFSRILEIDPNHRGAKSSIELIRRKMKEKKRLSSPKVMAKKLLRSGRIKYSKKDYEGAIEDFQDALVLDYANKDILEWLKRASRRKDLEDAKTEKRDLSEDVEIAEEEKGVQEKMAMLDVEKAYLPAEKPERRPVEIEEIVSPEEEREEKARQKLLKKLQEKMVPAVSLAEADIRDVIRELMEITGVTIVIDEGALAEAVGKEPLRITLGTVNPLPLLEVLDIALRATELSYRVEPNYIWISTPEKLEKENLVTRTYRLRYGVRRIRKVELKEFETKSSTTE